MSQDRLRGPLQAAAEAARAHPGWQPGDELVVILADAGSTVLHSWGFGPGDLAACLEYLAAKERAADYAATPAGVGGREQRENDWFLSRFDEIADLVAPACTDTRVNEAYRLLFAQRARIRQLEGEAELATRRADARRAHPDLGRA